jgi:hypothetical protein
VPLLWGEIARLAGRPADGVYGEYLDWHPHIHALMADGLFAHSGLFYVMPNASLRLTTGSLSLATMTRSPMMTPSR